MEMETLYTVVRITVKVKSWIPPPPVMCVFEGCEEEVIEKLDILFQDDGYNVESVKVKIFRGDKHVSRSIVIGSRHGSAVEMWVVPLLIVDGAVMTNHKPFSVLPEKRLVGGVRGVPSDHGREHVEWTNADCEKPV
tara:strand:+ start:2459 stop:2866 length:408 start_codon:yes stop_codon:yes gene_type:complete